MRRLLLLLLLVPVGCTPRHSVPESADPSGKPVTFPSKEGTGQGVLLLPPAADEHRSAVLVLHGDHGLTQTILGHARTLAAAGHVVLAVDLYRGEKIDQLLDAHIMDRGLSEERVKADLKGAVDFLSMHPGVDPERIGIVGWDMGGGYALDAALADPRLHAVVTCYGRLTTDAGALRPLNASVLGIFAGKDEGNPPQTLASFRRAMSKAGKRLAAMHVHADANHGFMNPMPGTKSTPADERARQEAFEQITRYLEAELQK